MAAILRPPVNAHAVRKVGLDVGHGARLGDFGELARREQALAGRQRAIDAPCDVGHRRGVAGLDDLLAEQRLDRLDRLDVGDRRVERIRPAVEVGHDVDAVADPLAHGRGELFDVPDRRQRRVVAGIGHEAELDGVVAHLDGFLHRIAEGTDVGVGHPRPRTSRGAGACRRAPCRAPCRRAVATPARRAPCP